MRYLSRDSKSVYLNIEHFDTQTSAYLYRLPTNSDNSGTSLTTFNPCQPSEILTSLSVLIDAHLRGHCDHSLHVMMLVRLSSVNMYAFEKKNHKTLLNLLSPEGIGLEAVDY